MRKAQTELGTDHAALWATREPDHEAGAGTAHARVLVEVPDGAVAWALWRVLRRAGYATTWCPGPDRARGQPCPLVTRGICELVQDADVVVSALGSPPEPWRAVLQAQAQHHPHTPVVVGATAAEAVRLGLLPAGSRPLRAPLTAEQVLSALEEILAARPPTHPAHGTPS